MHRSHNRGRRSPCSTGSILEQRVGPLVCRDCGRPCLKGNALRVGRGRLRCARCGGMLDRYPELLAPGRAADAAPGTSADGGA